MIHFLINEEKQAEWQNDLERIYMRELRKARIDFGVVTLEQLKNLPETDYVWICHHKDILTPEVKNTPAKTMFQIHCMATHPYCYWLPLDEEKKQVAEYIDIWIAFSPRVKKAFLKEYPEARVEFVGFPTEFPHDQAWMRTEKKQRKRIVVAGRISPDKLFYETAYLLRPYLDEEYQVVFCLTEQQMKDWGEFYHLDKFERIGFQFKVCTRNELLAEMSRSEFYFIASLGDVSSVSCIESQLVGCYPVYPKFRTGLPAYDDYLIGGGYTPWCATEIRRCFEEKPPVKFDDTFSDPTLCTKRLISALGL